jgi:hypothetical protein
VTNTATFSNNVTVGGNMTVTGNLTVSGTTTYVNTATLNVADNIVTLNADVTGAPTENSGVEVNRGTSANVSILWNETSDKWTFSNDGATYLNIASNNDVTANAATAYSNAIAYSGNAAQAYTNAIAYSGNAVQAYTNAITIASNATNLTTGTVPSGRISGSYTGITGVGTVTVGTWQGTSISTSYTDAKVSSVSTGNGLTGGPITSSGTISAVGNSGIVSNSTGIYVNANNGIVANSTGVFVNANTGLVANSTGAHVNSSYIATIAANSATYANASISNTFTVGTASYFVSNGNLGIANSTPANKLVVAGTIESTSGGFKFPDGTTQTTVATGTITGGQNLGTGNTIFTSVNGANLQFRSVKVATTTINTGTTNDYVSGVDISIEQNANDLTIRLTVTKRDGYQPPVVGGA